MQSQAKTRSITDVVNLSQYPLHDQAFRAACQRTLDREGALVLRNFLLPGTMARPDLGSLASIQAEGIANQYLAYYTTKQHNIYLAEHDPDYPDSHPRNRTVTSSKGCITTDLIPTDSDLRVLYNAPMFREFLCAVLNEQTLYEYADPLSSINLHYASESQELGWHFDNSSFAVTLLIQQPEKGGVFEYVKDVRDADSCGTDSCDTDRLDVEKRMGYALSEQVLDGAITPQTLAMKAGTLVLFRGRNAMHRVTPVVGNSTRMLAVLAYNTEPGLSLSASARLTFFGRLE